MHLTTPHREAARRRSHLEQARQLQEVAAAVREGEEEGASAVQLRRRLGVVPQDFLQQRAPTSHQLWLACQQHLDARWEAGWLKLVDHMEIKPPQ